MDICQVPALWLKALNKHSVTQTIYIKMEMLSVIKTSIKKEEKANT